MRNRTVGHVYDAVAGLWIPRAVSLVYHARRCARILQRNFLQLEASLREGVQHLCVGHTHRSFSSARVGELLVHNTGSTIRGNRFLPLGFSAGAVEHIE